MDDLRERYQKAFSSLEPSQETRERILSLRAQTKPARRGYVRRLSGAMAAAIVMLALLGCAAVGAVYASGIQGWFSHYWEALHHEEMSDGQKDVIHRLTQDISQSQTVDGVTVTVDSATVGDDTFFLLLRVEGKNFSRRNGYGFDQAEMDFSPNVMAGSGMGAYGLEYHGLNGDGSILLLMDMGYSSAEGFVPDGSPLNVELKLQNLCQSPNTDREELIAEGTWNFTFTLDRSQIPAPISLPDTEIDTTDINEQEAVSALATDLQVTCTGLRFRYRWAEGALATPHPSAILKDGTEIRHSGGVGSAAGDGLTTIYSYRWSFPVDLDEVAAVRIENTEIPVPQR